MSTPTTTRVSAAGIQQALDALKRYTAGSSRGALMPLDDAVAAATSDPAAGREVEQRLLTVLEGRPPLEATEYICRKLARIGSAACVPAAARLLGDPATTHAAREVLETLPVAEAGEALRRSLASLSGAARVGVILSLGLRREPASLASLTPLLEGEDQDAARAAASALGEIGSRAAAEALAGFLPKAPSSVRLAVADACLVSAERLGRTGKVREAGTLYELLTRTELPEHINTAATLGRQRLAGA